MMLRSSLLSLSALFLSTAAAGALLGACSNDDVALGSQDQTSLKTDASPPDGSAALSACQAAGGFCEPTGAQSCTTRSSDAVDDCNPDRNPAGSYCCLDPEDGGSSTDAATADSGALPACTIPDGLDTPDADITEQCAARRTLLSCTFGNGIGETCVSDDPAECPPDDNTPDASFTCVDQCNADEYGAECGLGPTPAPTPPAGCRAVGRAPSGTVLYCCPCGS